MASSSRTKEEPLGSSSEKEAEPQEPTESPTLPPHQPQQLTTVIMISSKRWKNAANSGAFFTEIRSFILPSESKSIPSSFIQPYVPLSSISSTALCKRRKAFYFALPALLFSQYFPSILADGCCIMDYVKVRNFLILDFQNNFNSNNLRKPRVVTDLAIPLPFAYAIQQLGIVSAVDLQYQIKYAPAFPDQGHDFGLPPGRKWSSHTYCDAVTYARSLGMQFSTLDLKKEGTA